jgi:TonB-dependent starch-binding outer membrane protein SusC
MMRKLYQLFGVSALVLFACIGVHAQQQQVSGTIKDQTGVPMPGVNILLKGSTSGTTTDADGKFSLLASPVDILQISFIGYRSQEITVGNQTTFDLAMEDDLTTLSEVVVIGYGDPQKKALNTGANLRVKGDDLQKLSTNNVLQALQGQTPGVQITTTSGQPGSDIRVVIRGQGSVNGSGPLYVVDGVLMGDIKFLSPSDIESIDVMKDAASAAIYGSQGANGVVIVTTRRGKGAGKSQLTFDAFYGVQNVARKMPMLNTGEYAMIMNEQAVNSGDQPFFTDEEIVKLANGVTGWSNPRLDSFQINQMRGGTNWLDKMFKKDVPTQNYALGLTGGTETSTYSAGLSYQSQAGIIGGKANSNYERYNFRLNSDHKLYGDVLRFGQTLNFAYTEDNGIQVGGIYGNSVLPALQASPFLPYDSAGIFWNNRPNSLWNPGESNPYAQMVLTNQKRNTSQRIVGNVFFEVQPIKNLKLRTQLSMDAGNNDAHSFTPVYRLSQYSFNDTTEVTQNMGKYRKLIWDNVVSYSFNVSGDHHFEVLAGTSSISGSSVGMYGSNYNLTFNSLDKAWLDNSLNKTKASKISAKGGPGDDEKVLSYFGRFSYNFKETYLFNATFRADGSSNFSKGNRWGYFPSVSAGWVLTNETFMDGMANIFDHLKLRASWGQVGNRNIPANRFLSPLIFTNGEYPFGTSEGGLTPGAYQKRLSNPGVKWETSEQTNIGFDARLLQGKISASFDWYTKSSKDWLVQPPVLATAGADGPWINGGNVTNKGIELMLSYSNEIGALRYTVSANGAFNRNKVTEIPTMDGIIYGETNALFVNSEEFYRAQTGYALGYFYGYKTNGIFQTEEDVNNYRNSEGKIIQPDAKAGDLRYVDKDDNGVIDADDKMKIGDPNPEYTFGFNVQLEYKGFDFAVLGNGVAGNDIAQSYRSFGGYQNYTKYILDRWHGPGTSNTIPRLDLEGTNYSKVSDIYVKKGDFLRISNVTLGYDFTKLIKVKAFSQLRLYASALNLFTITKYNGMDPEIGYGPTGDKGRYASGIDLGYYPRPRTYLVGLNVKF